MSERLIDFLLRLAPRERLLLALLFVIVLPIAAWAFWLAPLADARTTAGRDLQDVRALSGWVQDRVVEQAQMARQDNSGPQPPVGISGIEQSLVAAGLRDQVTELSNAAGGAVDLRFDVVEFNQLIAWLDGADPGWGYSITGFRFEAGEEPGLVFVSLTLEPQS